MFVNFFALLSLALNVACVQVKVEQGWLEGNQLELVTKEGSYYSFKGIPYAAPPLGKLRFKAPEPPQPWEGIRNATKHGPMCIQNELFERNKFVNTSSEDCLFLNVYTPDLKPKSPLSVMFYIHGGGYETGSGNEDQYGPDFLVQQGVVVVTINYRLEALGFLSLDNEDVPGNAGMKDQVAALKWVKKNIAQFGGDPDNVTVMGQSSGGACSMYHMLSPMSKTLFKRAISMSGVPINQWSLSFKPKEKAFILGKQLGLDTQDPKELLEFLQSIPAEKLAGAQPNVLAVGDISYKTIKIFYFTPVVEKDFGQERFLTETPENVLKENKINQKEVLIGHSNAESIVLIANVKDFIKLHAQYAELLVPWTLLISEPADRVLELSDEIHEQFFGTKSISNNTAQELEKFSSQATFNYGVHKYIELLSATNSISNVYKYFFTAVSERNLYGKLGAPFNLTGASHFDDTCYLFDPKSSNLPIAKGSEEYKLVQKIATLFTNFAKYGNPTPDSSLTSWPAYNKSSQSYMDIGNTLTVGTGFDNSEAEFWDCIFVKAQQT
ncbi:hypothetical protein O0L34_g5681 [Tuta absoluta]|nr:hypothetical protein O0L34_g5681 [Tuta absoluta]